MDLKSLIDRFGDEFLTHAALKPQKPVEDRQDDVPHPLRVNNWGQGLDVGQISAVSVNPADQPVIFHRGHIVWDSS
jgi:hypothetical protein